MARLRSYGETYKKGPLLRTRRGKPWSGRSISSSFVKLKEKLDLPDDLVLHMARRGFITRVVESGTPLARAARLAGHNNTNALMRHYYHPDMQAMIGDMERVDREHWPQPEKPTGEETSPGAGE
jgi:site-specific recombinase XerC